MINGGGSHPHPPGQQGNIESLHALPGDELNGRLDDLLAAYFRGESQNAHCAPWLLQTVEKIEPWHLQSPGRRLGVLEIEVSSIIQTIAAGRSGN